eukprot:8308441-Pyramimonas_sp.AAC.1
MRAVPLAGGEREGGAVRVGLQPRLRARGGGQHGPRPAAGAVLNQTDRQTDIQTGRQTGRQTNRQTDRQTDRQTAAGAQSLSNHLRLFASRRRHSR